MEASPAESPLQWREGARVTGKYEHTMDAKGRVFVPAKLRERLGSSFHAAIGASRDGDGEVCRYLALYPDDVWQKLEEKISALPSNQAAQADVLLAYAALCEPDSQSRILIPQTLREYAGLRKDVTVIGMIDHVEIWDSAAWKAYNDSTDTEDVAAMMDMLGV